MTNRKAVEFLGLHPNPLRKYADEGKIEFICNEAAPWRYNVESYRRRAMQSAVVGYCRVSSAKLRDDLARQVQFMRERFPEAEIIQDIGFGLTFKRSGSMMQISNATLPKPLYKPKSPTAVKTLRGNNVIILS